MIARMLRDAAARIGGESARADAELLLGFVLGCDRTWLMVHGDAVCAVADVSRFDELLARRAAGEPVAYLVGRRGFWNLELAVAPGVLIPRPETELLVEFALARLAAGREARVLDLGTGSGAIALAVAHARPHAMVHAIDASAAALAIARDNGARLGIDNVRWTQGHWYAPCGGQRFGLVLSNPPYIADDDPHLREGDLRFEPPDALASGIDGLDAIREIVSGAPAHLVADGWIAIEHGYQQGAAVRALMAQAGLVGVDALRDLAGHERVAIGRAPGAGVRAAIDGASVPAHE
jgi:release factor glutamine methyltransferase